MANKKEEAFPTTKRDFLRDIERSVQKEWEVAKVFEWDAPDDLSQPKYMATFPYPYMNGRLHLGHTFTLSKAEFAVGYERLKGKRGLYPFGFHCTGMPIKACADRLKREIAEFGCPPVFPEDMAALEIKEEKTEEKKEEKKAAAVLAEGQKTAATKADPLAFHAKKSKVQAKSTGATRQWKIMKSLGVNEVEIPNFSEAEYWLSYFPPLCQSDTKLMGLGVDWRRAFITTDVNPYYDSFVRWQYCALKDLGKVKFGERYTIWSPLDGQPCADHDRAAGEGVLPQEYTLIKLEVAQPFPEKLKSLEKYKVYLVPGTLRPETMYGQTNCWVLPEGKYVAARINETDVFICTERAAKNMSFQKLSRDEGKVEILQHVTGQELIGTLLNAPLSVYKQVYVLPMSSIDPEKGTGVVTSVPSDAPDDYAALNDIQTKADYFLKTFNVKPEWAAFKPVPIINVPEFGDLSAIKACQQFKVKSQKDRQLLDQAKELVYTKGFYEGEMLVGEHKGLKVKDAKPIIKEEMIKNGQAVVYSEPAGKVISRSGDECVVALKNQWYLTYGEKEWRAQTEEHMKSMNFFSEETKKTFEWALGWMNQWACSRTYGLGSHLPWDPQYLIESLSDSTIYMAYYTVAHLLQGGVIDGSKAGPANIKPEQLTNEVWEYICRNGPFPESTTIPRETLDKLKREFNYWYPVDLRVSGKDLIQNHLTFFLYTHCAMFPPEHRPKAIRTNGHILLNHEKMSKSTGNFLTLTDAVEKFSADGMRYGLASAGDGMDDANFSEAEANSGILRLYTQVQWVEEVLASLDTLRTGPITSFVDKVFESTINKTIHETDYFYKNTQYREALRVGFFEFQTARDHYRTVLESQPLHRDLILRFIEVQAIILLPICPHFAEKIWKLLKKEGFAVKNARWPQVGEIDHKVLAQDTFLEEACAEFRNKVGVYKKSKAKNPNAKVTEATIFVSLEFPEWYKKALQYLQTVYNQDSRSFVPDEQIVEYFKLQKDLDKFMQKIMSLIVEVKKNVVQQGFDALRLELPFIEKDFIESNLAYIKATLEIENITVAVEDPAQPKTNATPGKPVIVCLNHIVVEKEKKEKPVKK